MIRKQNQEWLDYLSKALKQLTNEVPLSFAKMTPSEIPKEAGVYLISIKSKNSEIPYYVGRSRNIRRRLYRNHLMGSLTNARLKKYLINSGECKNSTEAKKFIRENCFARWFLENDTRKRGAVEGYVTGIVFPKYGIYEEH